MPPQDRRARPGRSPAVMVATVLAVLVSAALMWSVVRFASENPDKANLGDPVFQVGRAERLAEEIDDRGPFLFQDPLARGGGRNLYVQHLGDDPDEGWLAVEARRPDRPACVVEWDLEAETFVDCDGDRFPADGEGLTTYHGTVEGGQVSIDLRTASAEDETATTTSSTGPGGGGGTGP
ncbi:MAG: hypothetical protein ACRD0N_05310 [Acidimicrobiales bacterium]